MEVQCEYRGPIESFRSPPGPVQLNVTVCEWGPNCGELSVVDVVVTRRPLRTSTTSVPLNVMVCVWSALPRMSFVTALPASNSAAVMVTSCPWLADMLPVRAVVPPGPTLTGPPSSQAATVTTTNKAIMFATAKRPLESCRVSVRLFGMALCRANRMLQASASRKRGGLLRIRPQST